MKKDLRVQKTLNAIDNAIITLLEQKPFESITVQDISSEAMINRGTFYTYYKDKYELIESYQNSMMTD
ncbi:TetR/AcrR family transcriptional regulator, partial [Salinicoccus roseus]|uniref:TetR/AcrR family transcriptional regulator n=1 Tax=Salinicoccus roseus TaxID=45670 RepID=UPI001CA6F3D4